jgi:hypothetical protein
MRNYCKHCNSLAITRQPISLSRAFVAAQRVACDEHGTHRGLEGADTTVHTQTMTSAIRCESSDTWPVARACCILP